MAKRAAFIAKYGVLAPMDDDGRDLVAAVAKAKRPCLMQYWQPRHPIHHRKLFYLLKLIVDSGAWNGDTESLLSYLKFRTGLVTMIIDPNTGEIFLQPKSIAFASMDQSEFEQWFDRAIMAACEYLLEKAELFNSVRQEVLDALEPSR